MSADRARDASLLAAQDKALALFDEVVARGMIRTGRGERELSDAIRDLAAEMFGIDRYWHKRVVRAGPHTLEPYSANPPDRIIGADDIVFLDFGPILEQWEADVGRTFVLGTDPAKHRLADALPDIWAQGKRHFDESPDITGAQLFQHVLDLTSAAGWGHGASHAGHLVGEFPHEKINGDDIDSYITHGSEQPMRRPDAAGRPCRWILEMHLVDPTGEFGGFYEQLLNV